MKIRVGILFVLFFITNQFSIAQIVSNPIGSSSGITSIHAAGDNLFISGRSYEFGRPITGFNTIDSATGEIIFSKHNIQGFIHSLQVRLDSSFIITGENIVVNGIPSASKLVLVDSNGIIDTSIQVNTQFLDKSSSPDKLIAGTLGKPVVLGDTLILAGTFTKINGKPRMNLAAFDLRTNSILDWDPRLSYTNGVTVIKVDDLIHASGYFNEVNNQFHPCMATFDVNNLKLVPVPSPNKAIRSLDHDKNDIYGSGYFDKIGRPEGRAIVCNSLDLNNLANPPNMASSPNNPSIQAIVLDDKNGYFVGGQFNNMGDTADYSLLYIDSVHKIIPISLDFGAFTVHHLDYFNDTLLIVGASLQTNQIVHYFDTKSWKQISTPFTCSRTNANPSIYQPVGKNQFILSDVSEINGHAIYGNVLVNRSNGDWDWLPRTNNLELIGDTMYYTSSQPQGYQTGPLVSFQIVDSIPKFTTRLSGSIQSIISDGNGGQYVAGGIQDNSVYDKIVHILPDGTEDPNFNVIMSGSAIIHDMLLIGDTLYVAGDFRSQWTTSTGSLFLYNVKTNTLISNTIKVKGAIRNLTLLGDTLFLSGSFSSINGDTRWHDLAAVHAKTMSLLNWQPNINGELSSFTSYKNYLYLLGDFDSCSGKSVQYLCRIRRSDLSVDSNFQLQFDLIHPTYKPTFEVIKGYKDKLYIGGKTNRMTTNGKDLQALIQYDLISDSVSDLGLGLSHYYSVYDFTFRNDTMYLGGSFYNVKGKSRYGFTAVSLKDTGVVYSYPSFSAAVRNISILDNQIWVAGDFISLGQHKGDYYKYNLSTATFLPTPNHDLSTAQISSVKDHLYVIGNKIKNIDSFTHNRLYKYTIKGDSLLNWNANVFIDNPNSNCHHMINFQDTLCLVVDNYLPTTPNGPTDNRVTFISISADSGKIYKETTFDETIGRLANRNGLLHITGKFTYVNYQLTKTFKINKKTGRLDYNFKSDGLFKDLYVEDKWLWGANTDLFKIDKSSGADTVVIQTLNAGNGITQLHEVNERLYVVGSFDSFYSIKHNPFSRKLINLKNRFLFNPSNESITHTNLSFNLWPNLAKVGTDYSAIVDQRWPVGPLTNIQPSNWLQVYNVKTDEFIDSKLGTIASSNKLVCIHGDKLFLANAHYENLSFNKEVIEYDLTSFKFERILPGTKHCNTIVANENIVATGHDNGLQIFNQKTGLMVNNLPAFDGSIKTLFITDSLLYVGGSFSKVDGNKLSGIARLSLNSFKIVPFKTPFPNNCQVTHFNRSGDYLLISGYDVEPSSSKRKLFTAFNLKYESLHLKRPVVPFQTVQSSHLINNLLFITGKYSGAMGPNDLVTKVYNFNTGIEVDDLDHLNLKAENYLLHKGSLWAYGSIMDQTPWSSNFVSKIDDKLFSRTIEVDHYSPKSIGQTKNARMTITGYGFTSDTKFRLQNASDTLSPVDSTLSHDTYGLQISGRFNNVTLPVGWYDLVIEVPNDTVVTLKEAVKIDTAIYGKIHLSILGRDTIRPNNPSSYTIDIKNSGNFDYYNVPVLVAISNASEIKVQEPIRTEDSLHFGSTKFTVGIDSLGGKSFNGKVVSFLIPELPANGERLLSIIIKSEIDATSSEIVSWFHAPISGVDSQQNAVTAYSELLGNSYTCTDTSIFQLTSTESWSNKFNSGTRQELKSYFDWLERTNNRCGSSFYLDSLIRWLTPPLSGACSKYSSKGNSIRAYNGQSSFIDSIQVRKQLLVVNSLDPNTKIGFSGYGKENYTTEIPDRLHYAIHFENDSSATASVQKLVIIDSLDKNAFDIESVILSEISFGDQTVQFDPFTKYVDDVFELKSDDKFIVHIEISVDPKTGVLRCVVTALDRLTLSIENLHPLAGFLPPNRDGNNGNGLLSFFINRQPNASTIKNKASIIFDNNEAIYTPLWEINKDSIPPVSAISSLNVSENDATIDIQWSGTDNGCGLSYYSIFYSDDDIEYKPLLDSTNKTQFRFNGENEKTYYFFSIATDFIGNKELKWGYDEMATIGKSSIRKLYSSWAKIYPNPSNGKFSIDIASDGENKLKIYTVEGRIVIHDQFTNKYNGTLPTGIYLINLTNKDGISINSKLVVQ